jgi:hypothetical protein
MDWKSALKLLSDIEPILTELEVEIGNALEKENEFDDEGEIAIEFAGLEWDIMQAWGKAVVFVNDQLEGKDA